MSINGQWTTSSRTETSPQLSACFQASSGGMVQPGRPTMSSVASRRMPHGSCQVGKSVRESAPRMRCNSGDARRSFKMAQGVDGVAGAGAVFFHFVDAKGGLSADGQGEHLDAPFKGCQGLALLVRRAGRGYEQYLVQPSLIPALFGQDQMAEMNGIKGAAKNAHAARWEPFCKRCLDYRLAWDTQTQNDKLRCYYYFGCPQRAS